MSNIPNVSSAATGQISQDFQALGSALQSGNLSHAQSALATFEQDLQASSQAAAGQPFGKNSQANADFQKLTSAVNSGNLTSAQPAYSSLQSDLKGTQASFHGHHHHHHHGSGTIAGSTSGHGASGSVNLQA